MGLPAPADLAARCQPIELLVADVDGVLTDGVIALDDRGVETKHFHVRDGMAYGLWHRAGKQAAILSGRRAAAVERRAAELKIAHVLQGHEQKAAPLRSLDRRARPVAAPGLFRGRRPGRPAGAPGRRPGRLPGRRRGRGQGRGPLDHPGRRRPGRCPRSRRGHLEIPGEVDGLRHADPDSAVVSAF